MKRGTFQLMKSVNKSLVLNKIRTNQPISRAQIAKDTKLTPPTVSSIVRELLAEDLVVESSLGESQGGRKPTMLLINQDALCVIGVDAGADWIKCFVSNLSGKIVARVEPKSIKRPITEADFLADLIEVIHSALDSLSKPDKVMGIGVAMHGVVDVENGLSLVAPNLGLRDIPIMEALEKEFEMIVKVENDVRAMALGESWLNQLDHIGSMLMVNMGSGVGAGLVIDGKLYHGAADLAGEVGHMTIDLNGDVCTCGNKGCFQTFASGDAIVKQAKSFIKQALQQGNQIDPSRYSAVQLTEDLQALIQQNAEDYQQFLDEDITFEDIHNKAIKGDEICVHLLRKIGEIIGIALTNLVHVINPDLIVLGGSVSKAKAFILPVITEMIQQRGLTKEAKQTKIAVTAFGDDATLMGAVSLLLVELFETV